MKQLMRRLALPPLALETGGAPGREGVSRLR